MGIFCVFRCEGRADPDSSNLVPRVRMDYCGSSNRVELYRLVSGHRADDQNYDSDFVSGNYTMQSFDPRAGSVVQRYVNLGYNLLDLCCSFVLHLVRIVSPYVLLLRGFMRQWIKCRS